MPTPAESEYHRALLAARDRGYRLTDAAVRELESAFRLAARRLQRDAAAGTITPERAEAMRRQIVAILSELEDLTVRATTLGAERVVVDLTELHRRVTVEIGEQYASGLDLGALSARFDVVPTRALQAFAARGGTARHFRTLMRRHMMEAAPALDRILTAGIAQGMSTRRLAADVAVLLNGGERPRSLREAGLSDTDVAGLRTLRSDAVRIARSETLNALREGNRAAMVESPVVKATKWQLSGRHEPQGCACEVLSVADWYGYGAGYFPPEQWPTAPHAHCGCYSGAVILRHPSEWAQAKAEAPPARLTATTAPLPEGAGEWSPVRVSRLREQLARSLGRGDQQERRAA